MSVKMTRDQLFLEAKLCSCGSGKPKFTDEHWVCAFCGRDFYSFDDWCRWSDCNDQIERYCPSCGAKNPIKNDE
jgi:hypothetical protein